MNETLTFHLNCQRFECVIYLDLEARKPVGEGGGVRIANNKDAH